MTSDSLAAMSNEPQEMTVNGRTYKVGPLEMGDYAKVEAAIRTERREELLESMRFKMMDAEIIAGALAAVQNAPITLRDMLGCQSARSRLLLACLSRSDPTITQSQVDKLSPGAARDLTDFMYEVSGLLPKGTTKGTDADPTDTTSSTHAEGRT